VYRNPEPPFQWPPRRSSYGSDERGVVLSAERSWKAWQI
jgi:hypothetical protein